MNVLITGASSGIGEASALVLAERGADLMLVARREERLQHVVDQVQRRGGTATYVVADLEVESEHTRIADIAENHWAQIDVVVHNAGRGVYASVEDTTTPVWKQMFALNVDAPFYLTRALLPRMRMQNVGHHIYVSSMAGKIGYPFNSAYVAAKHALVGFVAALRGELVDTDVYATVVCPSGVASEWADATEGGSLNEFYARALPRSREIARELGLSLAPLKKMISSESVARLIMSTIDAGRSHDVYTHEGTMEQAVEAAAHRMEFEDQHRALWKAMREVYDGRR